ncbi:hypothetical protein YC2023_107051 [Brassica napus]
MVTEKFTSLYIRIFSSVQLITLSTSFLISDIKPMLQHWQTPTFSSHLKSAQPKNTLTASTSFFSELPETKHMRYDAMGLGIQECCEDIVNCISQQEAKIVVGMNVLELAELIAAIKDGTISGKIGKQILFGLLAKSRTVQVTRKANILVQVSIC